MRGKRTDLSDAACGIARSLNVIGDWWSLLIVRDALRGSQRFGEFHNGLGLAKNILSARLKKLVDAGILETEPDEEHPRFNRYILTERGEGLAVVLVALWQWGEKSCVDEGELNLDLVDKLQRQRLAPLEIKAADGRTLGPRDFGVAGR